MGGDGLGMGLMACCGWGAGCCGGGLDIGVWASPLFAC